jgi:Family of unknown function (DUF5686)/CarboxypepD_reg-like domain
MRIFLFSLLLIFSQTGLAQKIYGTVFNSQGDLLPYASITVKGTTKGASANDKAKYSLNVSAGTYTIVCQHLGFTTLEKKVTVKEDTELTFILTSQKLSMETVVIKSGGEDPAYEVIRNTIKKRSYYLKQVDKFTCKIYGKDIIKLKSLPKKVFGRKIEDKDRKEMGVDSSGRGIIYLSESVSKVSAQLPDKFKLDVLSSRVSGSDGFGFNFPAFISLYNNNVKIFIDNFNPRGFISPISDGAINFYKYKFLGSFVENGRTISSIKVTPRRKFEPLFTGTINIVDDEWSIHSFDLILTKTAQLEIMDTLQITQLHTAVDATVRRVKNQVIHFDFKQFNIAAGGNFLSVYSDYDTKATFPKKFFDNVVIKYDTGVNKKPVAYWDSARSAPLEIEEELDYKKKDSIFKTNKDSLLTKHTLDSINKGQPKIKPIGVLTAGINRFSYQKKNIYFWGIDPVIFGIEYNTVEGVAYNFRGSVTQVSRKTNNRITFQPLLRYGFHNKHFNPSATFIYGVQKQDSIKGTTKNYSVAFGGGKRVSQFNKTSNYTPLSNTLNTLLYGNNFLKIYENYFAGIAYNRRFDNGLQLSFGGLFEDRIPIENTTEYIFTKKYTSDLTPNYPVEKINAQFHAHQAFVLGATISFKPGQKYIQLPTTKIPLGSKYPTFTISYTKGIQSIFGSDVNFDKWQSSIKDDKNFKLLGVFNYNLGLGGFLNSKKVFIQDYKHFNGNRFLPAVEYLNSFQLAPNYSNSNTEPFYAFGHIEHHFNGLLTNKIPLFRRLNWNLLVGSNALYVKKESNYLEVFAGLENILKLLRVDVVVGYDANTKLATTIRIGAGGLLGSNMGSRPPGTPVYVNL